MRFLGLRSPTRVEVVAALWYCVEGQRRRERLLTSRSVVLTLAHLHPRRHRIRDRAFLRGLHQLCAPISTTSTDCPSRSAALRTVFGQQTGPAPDGSGWPGLVDLVDEAAEVNLCSA